MAKRQLLAALVVLVAVLTLALRQAPEANSQTATPIKDMIGVNGVVNDTPSDIAQVVGWIRDYHKWYWYEGTKGVYTWPNAWQYLDRFYGTLHDLGVKVMPDVEMVPWWASSNGKTDGVPDATAHSRYMGDLVSHYGNTIDAVENFNEPNQWWQPVPFPSNVFGTMMAGDYDAVKAANPNLPLVMAGLSGADTTYLTAANQASGGKFDVINFHWYAEGDTANGGTNPESAGLVSVIDKMKAWRDANAPGKPIWMSEFGWDTGVATGAYAGKISKTYAPEANAANYLLRAFMIMQGHGVDKSFVYMYRDVTPNDNQAYWWVLFNTSGLVETNNPPVNGVIDGRKKVGWYYLATMKNVLGDYVFDHAVSDGPNIYDYQFFQPGTNNKANVLWASNGARDNGYQAAYNGPAGTLVVPTSGSTTGTVSTTDGNLTLGERPVFVLYTSGAVSGIPTPTPSETVTSSHTPTATNTPTATRTVTAPAVATATQTGTTTQTGGSPAGAELFVNSGFEAGTASWNHPAWFSSVADVDTGIVHTGTQSFRFMGKTTGPYIEQDVAVAAGSTIDFSGWVNVPVRGRGMVGSIDLQPLNLNKGALTTYRLHTFSNATTDWVRVSDTRVLPKTTAWVRLRVTFSSLDGTVYLDDFSLRTRTSRP